MLEALRIVTVILVVLAFAPALAHALELPGKLRLSHDAYVVTQRIYYPGFTIAGISEPLALVATISLLALTDRGSGEFWLTLVALVGLIGMQATYWLVTHPVNRFWLQEAKLSAAGARFFSSGAGRRQATQHAAPVDDWMALRNRWELSHVLRAALAGVSLVALVIAVA